MSELEILLRSVSALAAVLVLPLIVGYAEHKVMAHMQGRLGPMYAGGFHGWAQLVADGVKFVQKEDITPAAADRRVFRLAPAVALVHYILAIALLPLHPAARGLADDCAVIALGGETLILTSSPRATSRSTTAAPMPDVAPVTTWRLIG